MTAAVPLVERLTEVLGEHFQVSGFDEIGVWHAYGCGCSWTGASDAEHRAHLARALLPVVEQAVAEARGEVAEAIRSLAATPFLCETAGDDNPHGAVPVEHLRSLADAIATTEGAE